MMIHQIHKRIHLVIGTKILQHVCLVSVLMYLMLVHMQRIVDTETSSMHEYTRETITRHSSKSCNHLNYPQTSLTISCKQIHFNTVLPT